MTEKSRSEALGVDQEGSTARTEAPASDQIAPLCHYCEGVRCEERTTTEPTTWGTDGFTEHGRHVFEGIERRYWHCPKCGDEFLDMTQAKAHEHLLNEAIKAKLGIDWLAENAARRARWKAEGRNTRGKLPK